VKKSFSFAETIRDQLIPMLEKGAEGKGAKLSADECEKLVFFLRTSVPLEPFLETFVELIHSTVAEAVKGEGA
jgi:hypothetical protein